jgi:hypothetical protein
MNLKVFGRMLQWVMVERMVGRIVGRLHAERSRDNRSWDVFRIAADLLGSGSAALLPKLDVNPIFQFLALIFHSTLPGTRSLRVKASIAAMQHRLTC